MRKLLSTIFACTMLAGAANAQNTEFAPLGSKWSYVNQYGYEPNGTQINGMVQRNIQYETILDSLDNNIHYKKIKSTAKIRTANTIITKEETYLVYEHNDTLFCYNKLFQKYTPLYVYNVAVGDSFSIPIYDTIKVPTMSNGPNRFVNPQGDSVITFKVDSIKTVNYGNVPLQTFFVTCKVTNASNFASDYPSFNWAYKFSYSSSQHSRIYTAAYTRLFGGVGQGLLPRQQPTGPLIADGPGPDMNVLNCFKNATVNFQLSNMACDSLPPRLSTKDINSLANISVYPNPATTQLNITTEKPFDKNTTVTLIDVLGRTVSQPQNIGGLYRYQMPLNAAPGLYTLVFGINGERYYKKVVVK